MTKNDALENLVRAGLLRHEPPGEEEIAGLLRTGSVRLKDAQNTSNAPESRFDLAYNAAHALALAALRFHGYRSDKRFVVFQALPHTLGVSTETWRILDRCHRERNATEYEGFSAVDEKLLEALIAAALEILARVRALAPPL